MDLNFSANSFFDRVEAIARSKRCWVLFFITAAIIYSPLFTQFKFIVSTTDSIYNHYPNILYGYRALRHFSFGLWNPYLFSGMNFTTSMHNHFLNPANWILLLFPEHYIFHVITFIEFIEISLIGVLAFKIVGRIFNDPLVALFTALIVQLSGFTWFVTMTFIGVEFFLLTMLLMYLIVTYHDRRTIVNFIYFSLCFFSLFAIGHLAYIISFLYIVAFFFLIINGKKIIKLQCNGQIITIASALLFGFALCLYRIVPVVTSVVQDMSLSSFWLVERHATHAYLMLTGFIPGLLGATLSDSLTLLLPFGVHCHIQFHNLLYFSLPLVFLVFFAMMNVFSRFSRILAFLLLFVLLGSLGVIGPIENLLELLFLPLTHDMIFRTLIAFLFFFMAAVLSYDLIREKYKFNEIHLSSLIALVGVVLSLAVVLWIKVFHAYQGHIPHYQLLYYFLRVILFVLFISFIVIAIFLKATVKTARILSNLSYIVFFLFSIGCLIISLRFKLFTQYWIVLKDYCYLNGAVLWSLVPLILLRNCDKLKLSMRMIYFLFALSVLCLLILVLPIPSGLSGRVAVNTALIHSILATVKFVVIAALSWELFVNVFCKKVSSKTFVILLIIIIFGELLFYTKLYSYAGNISFLRNSTLYPPIKKPTPNLNLKQFRMNNVGYYNKNRFSFGYTNLAMVYRVRAYGGVDSVVPAPLREYLSNFILPNNLSNSVQRIGIVNTIENPRVLDLFGVKYDYTKSGQLIIRPNALARFSLFSTYQYVPSQRKTLSILKDPKFNIEKTVVLNKKISWKNVKREPRRFQVIKYQSPDSDHISLLLNQPHPAIVFFGDSYSKNWRAYWNGKEVPVMLADGYFMAVSVPAGEGQLKFVFYPSFFMKLVKLDLWLFLLLLLLGVYTIVDYYRRK